MTTISSSGDVLLQQHIQHICEKLCVDYSEVYDPENVLHFFHCDAVVPHPCLPIRLTNVVVVSETYDGAVFQHLMEYGVRDCLTRPLDLRHLERIIDLAAARQNIQFSRSHLPGASNELTWLERAAHVAPRRSTVLIVGPTGVGKNFLARQIHQLSGREGPLVLMNCGAINQDLIESELFGHVAGAFTGAKQRHHGFFEQAQGGTLVIDEVNSLPLHLQSRLLHIVEERQITPVGSEESIPFTGRLIVSSNENLAELVGWGRFREDLYYRLNVVKIDVPPLCERRNEILPLFCEMLQPSIDSKEVPHMSLSASAEAALMNYQWPGNIRQLRNAAEYVMAYSDHPVIEASSLPKEVTCGDGIAPVTANSSGRARPTVIPEVAKSAGQHNVATPSSEDLKQVLAACHNNRSAAARAYGVSRTTFYKWLHANHIATRE